MNGLGLPPQSVARDQSHLVQFPGRRAPYLSQFLLPGRESQYLLLGQETAPSGGIESGGSSRVGLESQAGCVGVLEGGQEPEEGDEEDAEGLANAKHQGLQRHHGLPRCLVHASDGSACGHRKDTRH